MHLAERLSRRSVLLVFAGAGAAVSGAAPALANQYWLLANRWKGTCIAHGLDTANSHAKYLTMNERKHTGMPQSHWYFDAVDQGQGLYRIQNRKSQTHIHVQHGILELGPVQPQWWSAQWHLKLHARDGGRLFFQIQNRWTGAFLHIQDGPLKAGPAKDEWWSAQWEQVRVG